MSAVPKFTSLFVSALCLCGGAAAYAGPNPQPTATPLPEIGHVITTDRTLEPLGAGTRTTYVVTRSEMIRRGAHSVADAIENVAGVSLRRYGPQGALATAGVRGSLGTQVLVLRDGIAVGGAQTATVDLAAIPLGGVERIEIVEGGGSTLYGTGAVGGVINIISARPARAPQFSIAAGSFGQGSLRFEDGGFSFERRYAGNAFGYPGGVRTNADDRRTAARLNFERLGRNGGLQASAGLSDEVAGDPGPLDFLSATSRQAMQNADAHATWSHALRRATFTLEGAATVQRLVFTCQALDPNCFPPPGATTYTQLTTETRTQIAARNSVQTERSQTIYGIDLARGVARIDDGSGDVTFRPFAQAAIFAQERLRAGATTLAFGLRAERDGALGGEFSPSLGFKAPLGRRAQVRANYATAFRAPTTVDLYFPFFGNPDLKPERARVSDLALLSNDENFALGWFGIRGNNLIDYDPQNNFRPANILRASIAGFTIDASTKRNRGLAASLNLTDLYRALNVQTMRRIYGRGPVFTVNLGLTYLGDAGTTLESAGILAHSAGPRADLVHGFADPLAGNTPYSRIDAYLRLRIAPQWLLSVRTFNLGGERYAEVPGFPLPARTLTIELSNR